MFNLVANALKFTRDGAAPEVEIAAYEGGPEEPAGEGLIVTAGLGWVAFTARVGQPLARLSYDMMFLFRSANRAVTDIQIVDIDEASSDELQQPRSGIWSRTVHAQLLRRLRYAARLRSRHRAPPPLLSSGLRSPC